MGWIRPARRFALSCRTLSALLLSLPLLGASLAPASAQSIEVETLKPLDAWASGAPQGDVPPLPMGLWARSTPDALAALFEGLPQAFASPAAAALALRTLTSPGEAPPGDAYRALTERYEALGRLGAAEALSTMVRASPLARKDPSLALFAAQADLALGDVAGACGRLQGLSPPSPTILKLRAFCFAAAGEGPAADVAVDIARSAGAADPFLYAAIPVLTGSATSGPAAKFDTALNATASLKAKLKPGPKPLAESSNLALVLVANSADAPPAIRAEAALSALRRGLIGEIAAQNALREAAQAWPKGKTRPPALAQAVLAANALEGPERTAKIADVLGAAKTLPDLAQIARLFRADVTAAPQGEAPAAALFAKAALVLGDYDAAALWAARSPADATDPLTLQIRSALAASGHVFGGDPARAAVERVSLAAGQEAAAARALSLFTALGVPDTPATTTFLAVHPPPPGLKADEARLAALVTAAQNKAVGETALLAALLIAPGADRLETKSVVSVIQALRQVGLEDAARAVAVEAMLG